MTPILAKMISTLQSINLFSQFPEMLQHLLAAYFLFKIFDFASGFLKVWKGIEKFKSRTMRDGLVRWIAELVGICFVIVIDLIGGLDFKLTIGVVGMFTVKEAGSIYENLKAVGVDLGNLVKNAIAKLGGK